MTNRVYARQVAAASAAEPLRSDEELMRDLARGQQEALGPLYSRYAALVFHLGVQSLGRTAAEELVQEVFLTMWRGATSFDPSQGPFRPWLLRLTHWKILNELRRRRRRPAEDDDDDPLEHVVDDEPGPEELAWLSEHEKILHSAVGELAPLRLLPAGSADVPAGAHANYRGRADNNLAVLTTELLPPAPADRTYEAWVHHAQGWTSLGTFEPKSDGTARLIAESPELGTTPDAIEITLEPRGGSQTPSPEVVLVWPSP